MLAALLPIATLFVLLLTMQWWPRHDRWGYIPSVVLAAIIFIAAMLFAMPR
jgi:hypothetical protein